MSEEGHPDVDGALAAWALDSCPSEEAARIAEHVASCGGCAAEGARLHETAGLLASVTETAPPRALRGAVLSAARRRRRPGVHVGLSDRLTEAYARQVARMDALLSSLTADDWRAPVARYDSVRHLVGHLAGNDAAFAGGLGLVPAHAPSPQAPGDPRGVWRAQADAVVRGVTADAALLEREAPLAGPRPASAPARTGLVQRTFETWTHADDIRAVVGRPVDPPPGGHLRLIVEMAVPMLPHALRATGRAHPGRTARLRLTGPGGGEWLVPLAPGTPAPSHGGPVGVTVTASAEEFCRQVANRRRPEAFPHVADGDAALASDLLHAAATLGCD
ncbi:zf-HC2 domain-containing protein [Actinomadura vinacea]|uniref:Zf-HC2 domain-containing protein n=1 Tax=Actinomadura vinacea TaxID=115336 RepID=A0ABP5WXY0_9ACTN